MIHTLAFLTPNLNFRGSCVALYDYAHYNELILNNKSIIFSHLNTEHDEIAFKWFVNRFPVIFFKNIDEIDSILIQHNVDILYVIKYGTRDKLISNRIPTIVHCVFDMSQPHGNVYAGVSKSLAKKFKSLVYVPHMISMKPDNISNSTFRELCNIPENAIVFGRHGGIDTFNLHFAKIVISDIVRTYPHIYFLFINAPEWDKHPQIIFMKPTTDIPRKKQFIRTCDAMIVPEQLGHTFGMAVAEFSIHNKPIIVYNGHDVWNTSHIDILADKGIYFKNKDELYQILTSFEPNMYKHIDLNAYTEFTPKKVMKKFNDIFIKPITTTPIQQDGQG